MMLVKGQYIYHFRGRVRHCVSGNVGVDCGESPCKLLQTLIIIFVGCHVLNQMLEIFIMKIPFNLVSLKLTVNCP